MRKVFAMASPSTGARVGISLCFALVTGVCLFAFLVLPPFLRLYVSPLLMIPIGLIGYIAYRMDRVEFTVDASDLDVHGDLFSRRIPRSEIRGEEIRLISAAEYSSVEPILKQRGTGLPGYYSGWFKLRNGDTSLIYVSEREKAVYVPTTQGYSLLLTPDDPVIFIDALRHSPV